MGYLLAFGPCAACRRTFAFNPDWVPSVVVDGEREPICRACVTLANPRRVAAGLPAIHIHPDAYQPKSDTDGYDTDGYDTDGYDTDGYDTDGYDTD